MEIIITQGCRSDIGLSTPIIKRLEQKLWCDVIVVQLKPQDFIISYQIIDEICKRNNNEKILFCTGDRVEMCAAAAAAFHNKIPIAHLYAGVIAHTATFDDYNRHCITIWSDIQLCESVEAQWVVWDLKHAVGLKANSFDVGITHLDDLEIDESLVPNVSYDLVLINAETLIKKSNFDANLKYERPIIQIGGNPDGEVKKISIAKQYDTLPRPQFLGLLKNCQRFITNSSAAYYEAPFFLKPEQIIMVGLRNRNRHAVTMNTGASDKIVGILKEYLNV